MPRIGARIPEVVVRQHVQRLVELMHQHDMAAVLLFHPANMLAFTGTPHGPWDRLTCALVTREGHVLVLAPAFERPAVVGAEAVATIYTWRETEDAYSCLADALRGAGVKLGTLGLDGRTWIDAQERIAAACPFMRLASCESLLREVRIIKTRAEQELMRAAHGRGAELFSAIATQLRPGVTEIELHRALTRRFAGAGLHVDPMIQSGPNGAVPHNPTGARALEPGDMIVVDSVVEVDGYFSDLTRTFALGEVSRDAKRAYQAVHAAQRAALDAVRPGVSCGELDAIARQVIAEAGFGDCFTHRLGHGIGVEIHEPPYLVGGSREKLRAGMCFTVEPGVYVPGEFGVRIEDDVAVTETGCEIISSSLKAHVSAALERRETAGGAGLPVSKSY